MSSGDPDSAFWQGKAVTVTGGGGFLGAPTVRLLESLGADVRAHPLGRARPARSARGSRGGGGR